MQRWWTANEIEELRELAAKPLVKRWGALKDFASKHGRNYDSVRASASRLRRGLSPNRGRASIPRPGTFAELMTRIYREHCAQPLTPTLSPRSAGRGSAGSARVAGGAN